MQLEHVLRTQQKAQHSFFKMATILLNQWISAAREILAFDKPGTKTHVTKPIIHPICGCYVTMVQSSGELKGTPLYLRITSVFSLLVSKHLWHLWISALSFKWKNKVLFQHFTLPISLSHLHTWGAALPYLTMVIQVDTRTSSPHLRKHT